MKNVTTRTTGTAPRPALSRNAILAIVAVVLVLLLLLRACSHHENKYEKIAHEFTAAVQANDLAAVDKLENAETQTGTTRGRLGHASDQLAPLGKIKDVKETTPSDGRSEVHDFLVTFDKGTATEHFRIDSQDKVVAFKYEPGATK